MRSEKRKLQIKAMHNRGNAYKRTEEINVKIEQAASIGCSYEEIALYAGISRQTLYTWMAEDPALLDRITELREKPSLKARQTLVSSLSEPEHAKWYLARKRKQEFSERVENDLTTQGLPITQKTDIDIEAIADGVAAQLKKIKTRKV